MNELPAISILLLEDSDSDAFLIQRYVTKIGQDLQLKVVVLRARNKREFYQSLTREEPKLILADYKLDDILGDEAMSYAKRNLPHIPFVFVTGTLNNEELAAQTILNGASGFVLKSNLPKLKELFPRLIDEIREGELLYKLDMEVKSLSEDLNTLYEQLRMLRSQTSSKARVVRDSQINEILILINHKLHKRQDMLTQRSDIMEKLLFSADKVNLDNLGE